MIQALKNIWAIPELRLRVGFTFLMLAVYRVGSHIPTPGVDSQSLVNYFEQQQDTIFGFVDMFSGGNFSRLTIFALGIMPYITASIILQLLTVVWPYLEKLSKEGDAGRKKITQYTRYGTVLLSSVQSFAIALWLEPWDKVRAADWSSEVMGGISFTIAMAFAVMVSGLWILNVFSSGNSAGSVTRCLSVQGNASPFSARSQR